MMKELLASRFSLGLRLLKVFTYFERVTLHTLREGNNIADALIKQGVTRNCELVT